MNRWGKSVVIAAAAAAGLAALTSIAGARGRSTDASEASRLAALGAVDEAIARQDLSAAYHAWRNARLLGLRTRGWRGPAQAADAEMRLAAAGGRESGGAPGARELYLVALFRARGERSTEGALRAAEGFARLGDREAEAQALRIAAGLADRSADPEAPARVRATAQRLSSYVDVPVPASPGS